jgi:hypothetical protein
MNIKTALWKYRNPERNKRRKINLGKVSRTQKSKHIFGKGNCRELRLPQTVSKANRNYEREAEISVGLRQCPLTNVEIFAKETVEL